MKKTVYLSLGSNLGDRAENLREAIRRLGKIGTESAVSSLYETEPVEVTQQQPWFLNCVAAVETELMPEQFLSQTLSLEQDMGRRRTKPRGPRTIDIDIVFFGGEVIDTPELTIPHPAMQQRRFVLEPLAEIAPNLRHPVLKKSVVELLAALPANAGSVRKYQQR
ncbi:MAG: 2-amino-4-hydroxy-6-hydroxymethyldihydropteridine diphosphokinase [Candidatus Angelobacter sp.]